MKGGERFICAVVTQPTDLIVSTWRQWRAFPMTVPKKNLKWRVPNKWTRKRRRHICPFSKRKRFKQWPKEIIFRACHYRLLIASRHCKLTFFCFQICSSSKTIFLEAPLVCSPCGSARNSKTRKIWKDGVIMCIIGSFVLHIEEFSCSNDSEGRCECVLLDKNTSAATHAFFRRKLLGVASSNGTLMGTLKHFHSQVISHMHGGVLPFYLFSRSLKTMQRLCTIMLVLMTLSANGEMFECEACECRNGQKLEQVLVICVDRIYQSYVKAKQVSLKHIYQDCKQIP